MAKVLVTGGAGYIGSHAVDQLLARNHEVYVLDNFSRGHRSLVHPGVTLIEGDISNESLVADVLKYREIDSVIHFAAFISVEESIRKPDLYYRNNFAGTVSLLKACQDQGVKNFIFSSTAAVYAPGDKNIISEDGLIAPVTPYGKSMV